MRWDEKDGQPRRIGRAVTRAVETAKAGDLSGYQDAAAELALLADQQVGGLLGAVVRLLLEEQHPDGLDGDDVRIVLRRCHRRTRAWLPPSFPGVGSLVAVISSALGVHQPGVTYDEMASPPGPSDGGDWAGDPDALSIGGDSSIRPASRPIMARPPTAAEYSAGATLLIADLLEAGAAPIRRYLDAAFAETARAETMEMP